MGVMGVPSALGAVLGGVIVDDWNWRWIFFINVPVCAAAVMLAWRAMPIGSRFGRSGRWGRFVKQAGRAGRLDAVAS